MRIQLQYLNSSVSVWRQYQLRSFGLCFLQLLSRMSTSSKAPISEIVMINGIKHMSIREGLASILAPYRDTSEDHASVKAKKTRNNEEGKQTVFYNPIQQFNRDLSVLAILSYGEPALIEKTERYRKKFRHFKRQRENAKKRNAHNGAASLLATEAKPDLRDSDGSRKRKRVDEASEVVFDKASLGADESNAKRTKTYDLELDEELEFMQSFEDGLVQPHPSGLDGPADHLAEMGSKHGPRFTILDALSATGLRALRYATEIPFVTRIIANDLSHDAVKSIEMNIDHNGLKGKVCSNVGDARAYMYSKVGIEKTSSSGTAIHRFDVIDLDPYGTAAPFFDAALQAIQDGGLLCVTCTDAGVFASNGYPEKAYALYGGVPLKGVHSHEGGLRLILHAVAAAGAKYGIAIEPLLSLSIDFYARLFIRIHKRQQDVKLLAGTTMIVYSCDHGCGAWATQLLARNNARLSNNGETNFKHTYSQGPSATPFCEHCGTKTHLSGPMWAGPLHNPYFIQRILDKLPTLNKTTYSTLPRIEGMLTVALEEDLNLDKILISETSTPAPGTNPDPQFQSPPSSLPIPRTPPSQLDPHPFFFIPTYLAKVLHCQTPSEDSLRGAFRRLGYRVTRSHCKPGSFKTDTPWSVVWEVMREWMRTKAPVKEGAVKVGTAGWGILGRLRGSERAGLQGWKGEVEGLMDRAGTVADLRTGLEAALFRLGGEASGSGRCVRGGQADGGTESESEIQKKKEKEARASDPSKLDIVFDAALGKEAAPRTVCRYQINPRPNWGPMNRAAGN